MGPCASFVSKLIAAAVIFGACLSFSAPAHAEKRVALVIGNSAYKSVGPLDNPKNDATLMAETLRSLGFTLVGGGAAARSRQGRIRRARCRTSATSCRAPMSGCSTTPVTACRCGARTISCRSMPIRRAKSDVDFQMLDANLVLRQMEDAGTKLNLVILDACRNNPFGGARLARGG